MKNIKKLLTLFVAMAMLVTVCVPFGAVFAADIKAEITITDLEGNTITGEVSRNSDVIVTIKATGLSNLHGYTLVTGLDIGADNVDLPVDAGEDTYVSVSNGTIRVGSKNVIALTDNTLATITTSVGRSRSFEVALGAGSSYATNVDDKATAEDLAAVTGGALTSDTVSIEVAAGGGSSVIDKPGTTGPGVVTSKSKECEITSFVFKGFEPEAVGKITTANKRTITVSVPKEADLTKLIPTIEVSKGATVAPLSGAAQDFTNPVEYTVTAEAGNKRVYTVTVTDDGEGVVKPDFKFADLADSHWAKDFIYDLYNRGIVSGDGESNTVRPDAQITRQEAAKIAVSAVGLSASSAGLTFTDAAEVADWAKGFVAAAVDAGIITGFDDGSFKPNDNMTREQFAAVIVRAFKLGEADAALTFIDADQIGWSKGYIAKAVELGIINGYEDNSFKPANNVSRAEAFKMLSTALNLKKPYDTKDDANKDDANADDTKDDANKGEGTEVDANKDDANADDTKDDVNKDDANADDTKDDANKDDANADDTKTDDTKTE